MLHLDWEDVSMVLQSKGHLTMGTERSSEQQVSWQALLAMPREEQLAWAQDRKEKGKENEDVPLVVEQPEGAVMVAQMVACCGTPTALQCTKTMGRRRGRWTPQG